MPQLGQFLISMFSSPDTPPPPPIPTFIATPEDIKDAEDEGKTGMKLY